MSERIYLRSAGGSLEPLEEKRFSTEDELQSLIADHPDLLDGEQIRPGASRRWICVCREKGLAETPDAGARWAVDLLLIDQDAVPTLVEVKRGANPEIRRTIVGQLLEYAAHAAGTWTADELRRTFEKTARTSGLDPGDELAALLQMDGEPDADGFWGKVAVNLDAKRLRLLFVADDIPDPLKRIAAFLNEQMPRIEVLAVEVKQFRGEEAQMIVPRVTGTIAVSSGKARQELTPELFLQNFVSAEARQVAEKLLETARRHDADPKPGERSVSVRATCSRWPRPITVAWLYHEPDAVGWARTKDFSFGAAILDEDPPPEDELRIALERWADEFSRDDFSEDVSSKGVVAWSVGHDAAARHADLLVARLSRILAELKSL